MSFILNSGRFGGVVDPGLALLQSATLWLDASDPGADPQKLQNKGTGGSALDARFGSTTGVDTNDPLLLTHTGTNYLYLPGANQCYASTPDAAVLDIAGDMEYIVRVALDDYTTASFQTLLQKCNDNAQPWLAVNSSGKLRFDFHDSTPTGRSATQTVASPFVDGTAYWIRAVLDVDNGTGGSTVHFYYAADQSSFPSSWTLIESVVIATTTGAQTTTNNFPVQIGGGGVGAAYMANGKFYRAIIKNGIAGTTVFDADFTANTNQSTFTESSSNAATVTINRSTSGRKSVMVVRPTLLFGTDDYLEVADNDLLDLAASGDMTVLALCRRSATAPSNGRIVSKRDGSGTNPGWEVINESATLAFTVIVDVGASNNTFPTNVQQTMTANQLHLIGGIFDRTNALVKATIGSTISSGVSMPAGDASNTKGMFIGRLEGATPAYNDMEIMHVAVFRSALTSTELGQIATYLGV